MQTSAELINKAAESDYTVVRLCPGNLDDLSALHAVVYGRAPQREYYSRKYDTSFTGVSGVGFIAYSDNKTPIAYYGVIPCFVKYRGTKILAAQSADTMTHPGYRYKGMFVDLSKKCFDLCRQLGIYFIFGFPNQQSYHGAVNKLGWQLITRMQYFSIPVSAIPLAKFAQKAGFLRSIYNLYRQCLLQFYSTDQKGLPNSVEADGYAGVCRDGEYLSYKSYSRSHVIELGTVKFWISNRPALLIGDIEGLHESNFTAAIQRLKRIARMLGMVEIQFHCCPHTRLYRLFEKHFTAGLSYPVLFQDFGSAISPVNARFCFADIDIF